MNRILLLAAASILNEEAMNLRYVDDAEILAKVTRCLGYSKTLFGVAIPEARTNLQADIDDCNAWLSAYDLDKRMRAALAKAAHSLNETCDMFVDDGGADEEDVKDMRDFARECAALAEEGVK